jgi:hypothetical protein
MQRTRIKISADFARALEEAEPYFAPFPMERKLQIARLGRVTSQQFLDRERIHYRVGYASLPI